MALPSLTLRQVKGGPLTFAEMDTNLQNLQGATINVSTGTGEGIVLNLNETLSFASGPGIRIQANGTTNELTITNTGVISTATTSTVGGIKVGANLSITADGTLSATASGSGFTGTVAILTATQALVVNGISLTQSNGNLIATFSSSTVTTSTSGVPSTSTVFQARLENNLVDDVGTATNVTLNSGTFVTVSKFGTHSIEFGTNPAATNQFISGTSTNLVLGTGNFTIEAWVMPPNNVTQSPNFYHKIFSNNAETQYFSFNDLGASTSTFELFWGDGVNSQFLGLGGVGPVIANQWNHVFVARSGTTMYFGANGTVYANRGTSSQSYNWSNFRIGGTMALGKHDGVRVSNSAIYPTTGTYTEPTAEFPVSTTSTTVITTSSALSYLSTGGAGVSESIATDISVLYAIALS